MNAKEIKRYMLIGAIIGSQPEDDKLGTLFSELAAIDFTTAFEVWECMLGHHQEVLKKKSVSDNLETKIFTMFSGISEMKTKQFFLESLSLVKLVYSECATSCAGTNLTFLTSLILSNKLESAEEILRCVKANKDIDYGEAMRRVLDTVFATYCKQKGVKKCELTRKQSSLLLDYISKIKGPNKLLLTQRIKEL